MATITERLAQAAELVGGKAWGADRGKPRIYLDSARDRKVFFDFPDAVSDDLGGAQLVITINDCGQHPNWYAGQKSKIRESNWKRGLALMAFTAGEDSLAREIMDLDGVTGQQVDVVGGHIANQRIVEARAALFTAPDEGAD